MAVKSYFYIENDLKNNLNWKNTRHYENDCYAVLLVVWHKSFISIFRWINMIEILWQSAV